MKKILVTTDFSTNSKKAIRFALQIASQMECELLFYNVIKIMQPTIWKQSEFEEYTIAEMAQKQKQLQKFVETIFQKQNFLKVNYQCACGINMDVEEQIISFAKKNNADYICISTRCAGIIKKLFGTNTSKLINSSPIPIIVVPHNYRIKPISSLCYASDLENLSLELKTIDTFSKELKVKMIVLHYDYDSEANRDRLSKLAAKYATEYIMFNFRELETEDILLFQMQNDIEKLNPSLLLLFTHQNKNWLERLFNPSKTGGMSFNTKIPMLVFRKKATKNNH